MPSTLLRMASSKEKREVAQKLCPISKTQKCNTDQSCYCEQVCKVWDRVCPQ